MNYHVNIHIETGYFKVIQEGIGGERKEAGRRERIRRWGEQEDSV